MSYVLRVNGPAVLIAVIAGVVVPIAGQSPPTPSRTKPAPKAASGPQTSSKVGAPKAGSLEPSAFAAARGAGTIDAWVRFLNRYPRGTRAAEAMKSLERLKYEDIPPRRLTPTAIGNLTIAAGKMKTAGLSDSQLATASGCDLTEGMLLSLSPDLTHELAALFWIKGDLFCDPDTCVFNETNEKNGVHYLEAMVGDQGVTYYLSRIARKDDGRYGLRILRVWTATAKCPTL